MSPFSIARMSGLSLQSVWGMTPSISLRSSFSCIAKDVKLYICYFKRMTLCVKKSIILRLVKTRLCRNQWDLGRVGWSGCNSPQELAARNHLHSVCRLWGNLLLIPTATLNKHQTHCINNRALSMMQSADVGKDWIIFSNSFINSFK